MRLKKAKQCPDHDFQIGIATVESYNLILLSGRFCEQITGRVTDLKKFFYFFFHFFFLIFYFNNNII